MCELLRPKQSLAVLKAANDPARKVEVKRVVLNRDLTPSEVVAAQRQQQCTAEQLARLQAMARQQAPVGLWGSGGLAAQQAIYSPFLAAFGGPSY